VDKVFVAEVPSGFVNVSVTLAPAAGLPPFRTVAVMGTVDRSAKLEPGRERLTISTGAATTVQLAETAPVNVPADALAPTGYVPGTALAGALTVIVVDPDCPGFKVRTGDENTGVQPAGTVALAVNEVA
jgi:hypothetical protein